MASSLVRTVTRSCSAHFRRRRWASTTSATLTTPTPTRYQLAVSVVLERPAVLTPPLTDLQRDVLGLLMRLENEGSLKSDHELRIDRDAEAAEKRKAGLEVAKDPGGLKTALDDEDDWKRELDEFRASVLDPHVAHVAVVSANMATAASAKSDTSSSSAKSGNATPSAVKSQPGKDTAKPSSKTDNKAACDRKALSRVHDRPLRLLVKQQWGVSSEWDLPKVTHVRGESLRQTAERAIVECCGAEIKAKVMGNAPFGFYKFNFPKRLQDKLGYKGQKVFIYKALYNSGAVAPQKDKTLDYEWLVLDEMLPAVDYRVAGSLEDILYDDEP